MEPWCTYRAGNELPQRSCPRPTTRSKRKRGPSREIQNIFNQDQTGKYTSHLEEPSYSLSSKMLTLDTLPVAPPKPPPVTFLRPVHYSPFHVNGKLQTYTVKDPDSALPSNTETIDRSLKFSGEKPLTEGILALVSLLSKCFDWQKAPAKAEDRPENASTESFECRKAAFSRCLV